MSSAPVTYELFDDARQSPFVLVESESTSVLAPRSGTITSLECHEGQKLTSGDVPLTIDSAPVAVLYTSYPLWRDLSAGDKGPDVVAVQEELIRLGYAPGSTRGVMDRSTRKALAAFLSDRGYTRPSGNLTRESILAVTSPETVISECPTRVASVVDTESAVFVIGGGLAALRPAVMAEGAAPGARVISLDGVEGPIDDDGQVTDPAFLSAVGASGAYDMASNQAGEGTTPQMTFTTALASPLRTALVPSGALFGVSGGSACISVDGVGHRVSIVSSMLGTTYVTIDDGTEPARVDLDVLPDRTGEAGACS